MADRQALSALRICGLFGATRPDLATGARPVSRLSPSVRSHHADPDARDQARPAYLGLRTVPGPHIEQGNLVGRDVTAPRSEPENRLEHGGTRSGK